MVERAQRTRSPIVGAVLCVCALVFAGACETSSDSGPEPDASLRTHVALDETPTPEGLAYIENLAEVHRKANAVSASEQVDVLAAALEIEARDLDGEAEVAQLDLAARLGQVLVDQDRAEEAVERLKPLLRVERSLPMHAASARALVVLGDAAVATGNEPLAAGSYARSVRMMSLLRQEIEAR